MPTYPRISPPTLANYAPVINDPQDTELANRLAQVDLQTRRFVYDFLSLVFDTATQPHLLAAALPATALTGLVSGSTSNTGTQQQVVQGTISTPDLRAAAVNTSQIANGAITTALIAAAAVGTAQIAAQAITSTLVANNAVGTAQMALASVDNTILKSDVSGVAGAVTTDHIRSLQVTAAKIAANVIGGGQLIAGTSAGQLLVTGTTPFNFAVVSMSGDALIDNTGKLTLQVGGTVIVVEQAALNTAGGAGTAATWNARGTNVPWVKTADSLTTSFLTTPVDQKLTLAAGTYLIEATCPAYEVDGHQCRINHFNSSAASLEKFYGSSERANVATTAVPITNRTAVKCMVVIAAGDYIQVEHYITTHTGTNDLGLAVNAAGGLYEIYAQVRIEKMH